MIKAGWQTGDAFTNLKARGVRISIGAMDNAAGTATITVDPLLISNHTLTLPVVSALGLAKRVEEVGLEDGSPS